MHQIPVDVKKEFEAGNFVVKRSPHSFNRVDPDQSQDWLNCLHHWHHQGFITLSRRALPYNLRSHFALEIREVFGLGSGDDFVHKKATKCR
ncbi:hypothetical protein ACOMHN_029825 [Nucella lapillus]